MSIGRFTGAALLIAIATHLAVIYLAPDFMMRAAMQRLGPANTWLHPPRVSETSRTIVRPSPDLAYSVCLFDLAHGPLRIAAEGWDDYVSLSLYAANGDNFSRSLTAKRRMGSISCSRAAARRSMTTSGAPHRGSLKAREARAWL